ncbi:hypothetical protein GCM10009627_21590 [Curtobacterium herbarum]|uniref:Secreted protein n=1 Tax=Curtobacterium herbarum TaxID=150122 RepID=A0ABP4K6B9_9MICO
MVAACAGAATATSPAAAIATAVTAAAKRARALIMVVVPARGGPTAGAERQRGACPVRRVPAHTDGQGSQPEPSPASPRTGDVRGGRPSAPDAAVSGAFVLPRWFTRSKQIVYTQWLASVIVCNQARS